MIVAYQGAEASWGSTVAIFTSIIFGYLVVAYFVGAKLNRSQVVIITLLYTFFSFLMIGALLDTMRRFIQFAVEIKEFSPERAFIGTSPTIFEEAVWVWFVAFVCAYVAGLIFMFQIRRSVGRRT